MNGLNLETFLRLLRVAPGAWASLGLVLLILALMAWTNWGSRRALLKCLVLSIAVHVGLIVYGGTSPMVLRFLRGRGDSKPVEPAARRIEVNPVDASGRPIRDKGKGDEGRSAESWDRNHEPLAMVDGPKLPAPTRPERAEAPPSPVDLRPSAEPLKGPEAKAPDLSVPTPSAEPAGRPAPIASTVEPPAPESIRPAELPAELAPNPPTTAPPAESTLPALPTLGEAAVDRPRPRPSPSTPRGSGLAATAPGASIAESIRLPSSPLPAADVVPPPRFGPLADLSRAANAPTPTPTDASASIGPIEPVEPPASTASTASTLDPPANPAPPGPAIGLGMPDVDLRRSIRPGRAASNSNSGLPPIGPATPSAGDRPGPKVAELARALPSATSAMPALPRATGRRPLAEVPSVYRSRLDPNRTALAQRAGASVASEQAVERALEWLARHQDSDGRWDAGVARLKDGSPAGRDDSYTALCPPADICFGDSIYWEADTGLTGLSLLAYLGAGYTHVDGKHAETVARGLDFLVRSQGPDGDLRGKSRSVGMYCHAMATLALCEAYALTGDEALKPAVEKGVQFLVRSRAVDGLTWRYFPREPDGDTSILGWAVMVLKSARAVNIAIAPDVSRGIRTWLDDRVAAGPSKGLARYRPGEPETPTMTAEAWACRQFLDFAGPGPRSDESAAYLLANPKDRADFNVYYLYYGTLAMYQHGGTAWAEWNARVRDQVVGRQRREGHAAGSWDPDDSPYGSIGGRIYATALSTLTLEVYYRFLRMYAPAEPSSPLAPRPGDPGARRANFAPPATSPPIANPRANPKPPAARPR